MFDVSWSDPERETVAQRRTRKEQQAAATTQSSSSSVRSSKSSKSIESTRQSTTRVSLLTFLNGNRKDKKNAKEGIIRSTSSSRLATARPVIKDESHASRRYSSYVEQIDPVQEDPTTPRAIDDNAFFMSTHDHTSRHSRQTDTSIFSARTEDSIATNTSWGSTVETSRKPSLVQPLSPNSFVTQTTEVTVSSSTASVQEVEQVATVVHISSNGNHQVEVNNGQPKQTDSPDPFKGGVMHGSSETLTAAAEQELLEPSKWPNWQPPESWKHEDDEPILPVHSSPPELSPAPPLSPLPSLPRSSFSSTTTKRSSRRKGKKERQIPSELSHLQKSIRMKEAATQKIMLERLKEEWMVNVDASVYRELELEKQLWMLTALRAQNKDDDTDSIPSPGLSIDTSSSTLMSRPVKILSLFENHGMYSTLPSLLY
ncbi:hypothetical protein BP5796_04946 [Coleophoma crateriformis]|uniref:Uncharacterized protein n=1 Tax=Coleophoma crateriformis TaxID=565419 RepID=A0A3D8SAU3_9HELO|nr:hypothetical protein BP5796_04946 [Coleophoma crateriformis]